MVQTHNRVGEEVSYRPVIMLQEPTVYVLQCQSLKRGDVVLGARTGQDDISEELAHCIRWRPDVL